MSELCMDELLTNGSFIAGNLLDEDGSISSEYLGTIGSVGKAGQPLASLHMAIVSKRAFSYSIECVEYENKLWSQLIYGTQVAIVSGSKPMYVGGKKLSKLFGNLNYKFNPELYGNWEPTVTVASGIRPDLIQEMENKQDFYKALCPIFGISSIIVCFVDNIDIPNGEIMREFFESVRIREIGTIDRAINIIFALMVDERLLVKAGDSYNIKESAAMLTKPSFVDSQGIRVKMCPIVPDIPATWDFLYQTIGATLESVTRSKHLRDGESQVNLINRIQEVMSANDFPVRVKAAKDQEMDRSAAKMVGWVRDQILKPLRPQVMELVAKDKQTIINKGLAVFKQKAKEDFCQMIFPLSGDLCVVASAKVDIDVQVTRMVLEMQAKKPMSGEIGKLRNSVLHVMVQKVAQYREKLMKDVDAFAATTPGDLQKELYLERDQWMKAHNVSGVPKDLMVSIDNLMAQYLQNTVRSVEEKWTTRRLEARAVPDRANRNLIQYETRAVSKRHKGLEVQGDWHLVKKEERPSSGGFDQCLLL